MQTLCNITRTPKANFAFGVVLHYKSKNHNSGLLLESICGKIAVGQKEKLRNISELSENSVKPIISWRTGERDELL